MTTNFHLYPRFHLYVQKGEMCVWGGGGNTYMLNTVQDTHIFYKRSISITILYHKCNLPVITKINHSNTYYCIWHWHVLTLAFGIDKLNCMPSLNLISKFSGSFRTLLHSLTSWLCFEASFSEHNVVHCSYKKPFGNSISWGKCKLLNGINWARLQHFESHSLGTCLRFRTETSVLLEYSNNFGRFFLNLGTLCFRRRRPFLFFLFFFRFVFGLVGNSIFTFLLHLLQWIQILRTSICCLWMDLIRVAGRWMCCQAVFRNLNFLLAMVTDFLFSVISEILRETFFFRLFFLFFTLIKTFISPFLSWTLLSKYSTGIGNCMQLVSFEKAERWKK